LGIRREFGDMERVWGYGESLGIRREFGDKERVWR